MGIYNRGKGKPGKCRYGKYSPGLVHTSLIKRPFFLSQPDYCPGTQRFSHGFIVYNYNPRSRLFGGRFHKPTFAPIIYYKINLSTLFSPQNIEPE